MAQHDRIVDNGPGLAVRTDINAALAALFSSNSGTVAPATPVAGQLWFKTTDAGVTQLLVRDIDNAAWMPLTLGGGSNITLNDGVLILNHTTTSTLVGVVGKFNNVDRWQMRPGDQAANDFYFYRYNDAGVYQDAPLTLRRSDGYVIANLLYATTAGFATLALTNPLPIASGGTAANNTASARANLGLDSMAQQNAGNYYYKWESDARYAVVDTNGGLGTVALCINNSGGTHNYGTVVAGSTIAVTNVSGVSQITLNGTWRSLGLTAGSGVASNRISTYQRIG
jgi:hypothetical protein